jgi:hypothetical protein
MRRIFWGFLHKPVRHRSLTLRFDLFDFGFEFAEIFVIEKRLLTHRVGESTRLPIDTIFFKPLNKSMVIVQYIPGFFYAKLIL